MTPRQKQRIELERSIKEMIKACHRFNHFHKKGALSGGICNAPLIRRLSDLEKQIQGRKKKQLSDERLKAIGREVAQIVSGICKSLISCIFPYVRDFLRIPCVSI